MPSNFIATLPSICSYHGSKGSCTSLIMDCIPAGMQSHVEPFAGSSKALMVSPCHNRVYNDLSKSMYTLMACLSHPTIGKQTYSELLGIPYSVEAFYKAKDIAATADGTLDAWVAANVWATLLMSKNGGREIFKGFGMGNEAVHYEQQLIKKESCVGFMNGVECHNEDALDIIGRYKHDPSCFMLVDPPYFGILGLYEHEFNLFEQLAHTLLDSKAKVMLFDYCNPYYQAGGGRVWGEPNGSLPHVERACERIDG